MQRHLQRQVLFSAELEYPQMGSKFWKMRNENTRTKPLYYTLFHL